MGQIVMGIFHVDDQRVIQIGKLETWKCWWNGTIILGNPSHERAMKKYHQGWHQTPRGGTRQCHIRGFMVATAVLVHHTLYDPNNH